MKKIILLFMALIDVSQASVWPTENQWSPDWEKKYSEWVQTKWSTDIFLKGPYEGLIVDCADAVYSMRIIFSYENRLPYSISDSSAGYGGKPITNEWSYFDSEPDLNKRFRKFLAFVYDEKGTDTLSYDTYSPKILRGVMGPGSAVLHFSYDPKYYGHSFTIQNISEKGRPYLINSTVPARSKLQDRQGWPAATYLFSVKKLTQPIKGPSGIRNFKQPADIHKPEFEVENYSGEQYQVTAGEWSELLTKRMALKEEDPNDQITAMMDMACATFKARVPLIREGITFKNSKGGQCLNKTEFDDYSTPSRDDRLKAEIEQIEYFSNRLQQNGAKIKKTIQKQIASIFDPASVSTSKGFCVVSIDSKNKLSLGEINKRICTHFVNLGNVLNTNKT